MEIKGATAETSTICSYMNIFMCNVILSSIINIDLIPHVFIFEYKLTDGDT